MHNAQRFPQHFHLASFPWLEALVLAPCSILAAAGVRVPWTAAVLVLDELHDSAELIWSQT